MKIKYIFVLVSFYFGITGNSVLAQEQQTVSSLSYIETIENARKGTNIEFMYTEKSPLTGEQKKHFQGLDYFAVDEKYKVEGVLEKDETQDTIIMKTSTSRAPQYIKYGVVEFQIDTSHLQLTVYQYAKLLEQPSQENHLFVPFRDETTSLETYGGGRYIDCEIPEEGNILILDFNKAYNPYCAYNHKYSCVLPPDENQLSVRIEAGEKVFEE